MKNFVIGLVALIVLAGGILWLIRGSDDTATQTDTPTSDVSPGEENTTSVVINDTNEPEEVEEVEGPTEIIGASKKGNDIVAHHFGSGERELMFIGGIHGGYSWNTVLVAYELMDYLEENPEIVPDNVTVTVIPLMNPDGLDEVIGSTERFTKADVPENLEDRIPGRFNGSEVDLNRNFDCEWSEEGTWQSRTVSGGDKPFSERESQAIRNYVNENNPTAVVTWYSAAGGVFSSSCRNGVSEETKELTNLYADASGYKAFEEFDFYEITGDMVNWFAKEDIPAISVLLTSHEVTEWLENKKGIEAMLEFYAE